ncbi:hypothetical protein NB705_002988 [Xanthomonas sacchari]|nr:hypothetical protein [Xanthomonas sacchari]
MLPTATTAGSTAHGEVAASGNTSNTASDHSNTSGTARNCIRSNSQPPARLPSRPPSPNAPIATGIQCSDTPVTSIRVGAR